MTRAIAGQAAIVVSPKAKPPVASLIQPMTKGPKKPARLPIELIAAMPGAAAAPARNAVGRAQKIDYEAKRPKAPMVSAIIFIAGSARKAEPPMPIAASA